MSETNARLSVERALSELMDRIEDARFEREFPAVGQGHPPIESLSEWPGCTGVLRLYPSGARACDCGDVVLDRSP